jgi:hypothetical protein
MTDQHLKILTDPSGDSYAIGNSAQILDVPLPCTAQVYIRKKLKSANKFIVMHFKVKN